MMRHKESVMCLSVLPVIHWAYQIKQKCNEGLGAHGLKQREHQQVFLFVCLIMMNCGGTLFCLCDELPVTYRMKSYPGDLIMNIVISPVDLNSELVRNNVSSWRVVRLYECVCCDLLIDFSPLNYVGIYAKCFHASSKFTFTWRQ